MLRPGVTKTGQDQNRSVTLHAEPSIATVEHYRGTLDKLIWFVWLVYFNQKNQTNQIDQTDQTDRTDQMNKTGWRDFFSILQEPVRCCSSSRGEGGTGRCATAGSKNQAYPRGYVEDFEAENEAGGHVRESKSHTDLTRNIHGRVAKTRME